MTLTTGGYVAPTRTVLPRVLLVDDEPSILDGLRRQLRRSFAVSTATGGAEGLKLMDEQEPFAAVVSDMRMPGMDGAAFLAQVRQKAPDTVRLLLTGQADTQSAIAAINDGQIFRFLTKPCPADALQGALVDATELHRLATAEKLVLEQTLRGAVQALVDILSVAHPKAFSRSVRISRTVTELCEQMGVQDRWEAEIAGMLAQVGAVSLPTPVLDKISSGVPLSQDEREMLHRVPEVTEKLLANIPRFESVAAAIGRQRVRYDGRGRSVGAPFGDDLPQIARILRVAVDFDTLTSQRVPALTAIAKMRSDVGAYDGAVLDAWEACHVVVGQAPVEPLEVSFADLKPGMVLAEDFVNGRGLLLLGRGSTVTEALLDRLRNHLQQDASVASVVVERQGRR
jgi:response regulator RpfG family c-di-GMP phosphodiesterase